MTAARVVCRRSLGVDALSTCSNSMSKKAEISSSKVVDFDGLVTHVAVDGERPQADSCEQARPRNLFNVGGVDRRFCRRDFQWRDRGVDAPTGRADN
jgi:hypothetical protein